MASLLNNVNTGIGNRIQYPLKIPHRPASPFATYCTTFKFSVQ